MEIVKELSSIAWNVPESVYRDDAALSYSTLSTYESVGFNGLDHLFDKKESPSLTLGSAVDSILTGGMDEFNERFVIINVNITDGGLNTINQLLSMNLPYKTFEEIPESVVSEAAKYAGFWKDDKYDGTRYKKVLGTGNVAEYYNAASCTDKTIITTKVFEDVQNCVNALRESPATAGYFAENNPDSPVRRYYQLKFKATLDDVNYRNMADLLIADYEAKKVYPIDLKTSLGCTEWDFEQNFLRWHY